MLTFAAKNFSYGNIFFEEPLCDKSEKETKQGMNKTLFTLLLFAAVFTQAKAQDSLKNNQPVRSEFDELIETSNDYQGYKVIDYDRIIELRNTTSAHIEELRNEITTQENTMDRQNQEIEDLESRLANTEAELERVNNEKDAITFLGMPFSKGTYKAIMWGLVGLLVLALLFFIYKYRSSHATTREARKRLDETEKEFDIFRAKSLEKEQRLGRLLQDERNKSSNT
ncbi:hypothetical protein [Autumnicola musiva]|uniref:tRNA (Guanine-N1)-methyltransferase n=1 Tax=Autumnicola musiva TaxID=3075589 RepID=A0ABU3D2Z3_9FLAO|nr:hypothetical protein [Zunongwangia sp. F117]MDT0675897.1 hypothetical protein [Zunongwangia sp. F117]